MQSGSHKCISKLAMTEQYNQGGITRGSSRQTFHPLFPIKHSLCSQRKIQVWGHIFPFRQGLHLALHMVTKSMSSMKNISL